MSFYEIQKIKNAVTKEFEKINQYNISDEILAQINQAKTRILQNIEENTNQIQLPNLTIQRTHHLLAGYLLTKDERKAWYYYHTIQSLITNPEIQKLLQKTYADNYDLVINRLREYSTIIEQIKLDLDQLEDKPDKDCTTKAYTRAHQNLTRIPLIYNDLHQIFYIITKNTNLGQQKIPNQIMQTQERQLKKIEYNEDQNKNLNTTQAQEKTI